MKILLFGAIALVALSAACAGPPERVEGARIRDVGESVKGKIADEGLSDVYKFEGIFFLGDMEISRYREIRSHFEHELADGEVFLRICNYRAWPDSKRLPRYEGIDFSVYTCTDKQAIERSTLCMAGNFWECRYGVNGIEIVGRGSWAI